MVSKLKEPAVFDGHEGSAPVRMLQNKGLFMDVGDTAPESWM